MFVVIGVIGFRPSDVRHFAENHVPLLPSLIVSLFYAHWLTYGEWPRLFGAGWTLEIETQYYIIAPALTLIYLSLRNKRARIAIGIATILSTSAIAAQFQVGNFWAGTIMKYFPYFFTGMMALELQEDLRNIGNALPKTITNLLTVIALFFYFCVQAPESGAGIEMFEYYAINVTCIMMMFLAVSIEGNILRRVCINRYVVIIGGACYSIYLTHGQVIFLLQDFVYRHVVFQETYLAMIFNALCEIPIALFVGLTFYVMIEKPFMRWGRK